MDNASRICLGLLAVTLLLPAAGNAETLVGPAAYGDWRDDAPGVVRLIRPQDMPPPFATRSSGNPSVVEPKPQGALPQVPAGFKVSLFAEGLNVPRVLRVAPNGDIFLAESGANRVRVYRVAEGQTTPSEDSIFASGFHYPYGIAFWPPGPNPEYVYIADRGKVMRFPYRNGDLTARGKGEVVVDGIPTGGHITRDIAFSPDGKRLFLAVGSASNAADGIGAGPTDLAAWDATTAPGAAWGNEAGRADVLLYDPEGGPADIYATGMRNCAGLAIEPQTGGLWCATNERDGLGDNLPPDYVTRVEEGAFYGWPWYYIGDHEDPAPQRRASGPCRQGHRAGRADPAPFGAPRPCFLRRECLPRRLPRRRLRDAARLVEPQREHRLQGYPYPDEGRRADRRIRGFPDRLRHCQWQSLGPAGGCRGHP